MKKIAGMILALLLVLGAAAPRVFAENVASLDNRMFDAEEYASLLKALYSGDIQDGVMFYSDGLVSPKGSPEEDGLTKGYKLYRMQHAEWLRDIVAGKRVRDLLSTEYTWLIPTEKGQTLRCEPADRGWIAVGYDHGPTSQALQIESDQVNTEWLSRAIRQAMEISGSKETMQVWCFSGSIYFTNFVLLVQGEREWLVPFGSRPDFTGLKNGELYDPKEAAQMIQKGFALDYVPEGMENESFGGGGGSPASAAQESARRASPYLYAVGCAVVLLGAAAVTVLHKRKRA